MIKKFTSKGKKSLAVVMALSLSFGVFITSDALLAEEDIPVLTKEAFVEEVLKDNTTIIDLEDQLVDLEESLEDLPYMTNGLAQIHQFVPTYNEYGEKITKTNAYVKEGKLTPRYTELLTLILKNPEDPSVYMADLMSLYGSVPELQDQIITGGELLAYKGYGEMFSQFIGLSGPTITPVEEYESFVEPIFTTEGELKAGIASLEEGIGSAMDGFEVGAIQLYNTVLMLEELLEVLELSYETSTTNYEFAKTKHEAGLVSDMTLKTSYNDMVSAGLSIDTMERDIDTLKMNMNVMMGRKPTVEFEVEALEDELTTAKLFNVSYYIEEGLNQRSEIISLNRSVDNQDYKRFFLRDLFDVDDTPYVYEVKQLELYKIELEDTENEITLEIHSAYNNVFEKEEALDIAYLDLEDAKRQYSELAVSVEQGFVTASTLRQLNLLVTNAVNDVASKGRDYRTALDDLTSASSFSSIY